MDDKTYSRRLLAVTLAGCALTLAHMVLLGWFYSNCSILSFLARGR